MFQQLGPHLVDYPYTVKERKNCTYPFSLEFFNGRIWSKQKSRALVWGQGSLNYYFSIPYLNLWKHFDLPPGPTSLQLIVWTFFAMRFQITLFGHSFLCPQSLKLDTLLKSKMTWHYYKFLLSHNREEVNNLSSSQLNFRISLIHWFICSCNKYLVSTEPNASPAFNHLSKRICCSSWGGEGSFFIHFFVHI